jgi:hypothetical protein
MKCKRAPPGEVKSGWQRVADSSRKTIAKLGILVRFGDDNTPYQD